MKRNTFLLIIAVVFILAPTVVMAGDPTYANVQDWGAVGDGIADDTIAIRNCINANTHVYFPPGTYRLTEKIVVMWGRTIVGVENSPESVVLKLDGDFRAFELQLGTVMRDLTLDRTTENNTEYCILAINNNIVLERLHILNHRSHLPAIMAHTKNNIHVRSCYIENYTKWWDDGRGEGVFGVGIRFRLCVDSSIKDNVIVDYQDWPLPNNWQSGAIEVSDSVDSIVSGNYIYQSGDGAIDAGGATNISIVNNRIDNVYIVAIKLVNGTSGCVVSGNEISRCGLAGIWLTPGSPGPAKGAIHSNIISNNSVRNIGYGVGQGQWIVPGRRPSAILLDGDHESADYVTRDNEVFNNRVYNSPELITGVFEDINWPFNPYNNVFSGNITLDRANIDGVGKVDLNDFAILARAWQSQVGDENWNFSADISIPPDEVIGFGDLLQLISAWLSSD